MTAKIIDLGLAKTLDESASEAGISSPGAFAGTPEFASQSSRRHVVATPPAIIKAISTARANRHTRVFTKSSLRR